MDFQHRKELFARSAFAAYRTDRADTTRIGERVSLVPGDDDPRYSYAQSPLATSMRLFVTDPR
ncbi:hypothetical protein [Changpingibacter yushuensis]|uniref:hypothetical protein n=1 Tax=Changpingibacter yushuensis TaxID=2758440 RepID=UPI00165E7220|nr:hypothetical protein [Changpingibacter yushuensis]